MDLNARRGGGADRMAADPSPSRPMPATARKTTTAARAEREKSVDEIYEKIYIAILEHRLHPGTKLGEERMADIFGVSRARVREVLGYVEYDPEVMVERVRLQAERARKQGLITIDQVRLLMRHYEEALRSYTYLAGE